LQKQSGNFLLQALLALTLVFAFLPFLAGKLSSRDRDAKMYAAKQLVETAHTVARIYIRENKDNITYDNDIIFSDRSKPDGTCPHTLMSDEKHYFCELEPYGLPIGFNPKTALGQDISLVINKERLEDNTYTIDAFVNMSGGNLSEVELKQLARMIGFYAHEDSEEKTIRVHVPFDIWDTEYYSVLVRRDEPDPENAQFDVELNMGNNNITSVENIDATSMDANNTVIGKSSNNNGSLNINIATDSASSFATKIKVGSWSVDDSLYFYDGGSILGTMSDSALVLNISSGETVKITGSTVTGTIGENGASVGNVSNETKIANNFTFSGAFSAKDWNIEKTTIATPVSFSAPNEHETLTVDASSAISISGNMSCATTGSSDREHGVTAESVVSNRIYHPADSVGRPGIDLQPMSTTNIQDIYVKDSIDAYQIFTDPFKKLEQTTVNGCLTISNGEYSGALAGLLSTDALKKIDMHSLLAHIICQYIFWERLERKMNYKVYCKTHPCPNTYSWP